MEEKIDFVVTWLDSTDEEWQRQFSYYKQKTTGKTDAARFRNMDIFQYWFRAVELYAPWVNKIFLVTNGTFPKWINKENPKLGLIRHSDYIPEEYLPTFNSRTIELYMHRIPELSEQFVYFNDDFFLNAPVTADLFFKDGLPCDNNAETIYNIPTFDLRDGYGIYMSILADIGVVNAHFNRRKTVRQSLRRWYGPHLGRQNLLLRYLLRNSSIFVGFQWRHSEQPFLKSVFEDAWRKAPEVLQASSTQFREEAKLNHYFFRYWQFASNRFYPVKMYKSVTLSPCSSEIDNIRRVLHNQAITSVCINDNPTCPDEEFASVNIELQRILEEKFPVKSSFEK